MARYVVLVNFTDQGIRQVAESPSRFEAFAALAASAGVTVREALWTVGVHDVVFILEGPDEAVTAVLLKVGSLGNIRTQALRGYNVDEMKQIVAAMPG